MSGLKKERFIAVDGGGTRCRLALVDSVEVIRAEVGSTNITTDISGALVQLQAGLGLLAQQAEMSLDALADVPCYLGVSGYQEARDYQELTNALPLKRVKIEDDRPAALVGALEARSGALVHSGTGSFFGVQKDGVMRFSGGWGAVLGDYGSAAWLGRNALALVLEAEDGLREKTSLTEILLTKFGSPAEILRFATTAKPSEFGSLAPLVMAQSDDPMAQEILGKAAAHFEFNLKQIGWDHSLPVCLSGGLAVHLAPFLTEDVSRNLIASAGSPLDGAIVLASRFAEEIQLAC